MGHSPWWGKAHYFVHHCFSGAQNVLNRKEVSYALAGWLLCALCFAAVYISSHQLLFLQESQSSSPIRGRLSSSSTRPPVCPHCSPGPSVPAHSLLLAQLSLPFSCFPGLPYFLTCSTLYKALCITSYFSKGLDYLLVTSALMTHPP